MPTPENAEILKLPEKNFRLNLRTQAWPFLSYFLIRQSKSSGYASLRLLLSLWQFRIIQCDERNNLLSIAAH